jgi:hypothetical protein
MFNPQTFAGVTGLLDRMAPAMSFPTQQGPGFMPPQATPAPQGSVMDANAMIPENATPTSGVAPMGLVPPQAAATPAPSSGGAMNFLGGVRDKINDNSNMLLGLAAGIAGGRNMGDGISKGLTLAMQGGQLDTRTGNASATARALLAKGVDPQTIQAAVTNPILMRQLIETHFGKSAMTNDQRNFEAASKDPNFATFLKSGNGRVKFGTTPTYGVDASGQVVLGVQGDDGSFKKLDLPQDFKPQSGVEKIDAGDHFELRDRKNGQVVGIVQKNIANAAAQREIGEAAGKATAAAPADIQAGENALDIVKKIRGNPYLERGTGASSLFNSVPGTGGYDFQNLVEQAKSGAFLTAIQQMRGLGSLSNAEGSTATAAVNRMNTATSKVAFLDAMSDYEKVIKQGITRARTKLPSVAPTQSAPVAQNDPLGLR